MRRLPIALWTIAIILHAIAYSQTTETTLHNFTGRSHGDGADPLGDLLYESSTGLVYGTTNLGGTSAACGNGGCGTVFAIAPGGSGYRVVYSFAGGTDGANPQAGLVADGSGNLYGTTYNGGTHGFGSVFKLMPSGGGQFHESLLYSFTGANDGAHPLSRLAIDAAGNLYGTTFAGGAGKGVVFIVNPGGAETPIFTFNGSDGSHPRAGVVLDANDNPWGTTSVGGSANLGTVFRLTRNGNSWSESFLYSFAGPDGANPNAEVTLDAQGDVFGTTKFGGPGCTLTTRGCGVVFELQPGVGGYVESVIYSFTGSPDGAEPVADVTLALDMGGNQYLYGTASEGGTLGGTCPAAGCGTAFELCSTNSTCGSSSPWTEYTLFDFAGRNGGRTPMAGMLVFLPLAGDPDDPLRLPPRGHGGCTSGCLNNNSAGGSAGGGTIDHMP